MLLVADNNETVVRYALAGTPQPMTVSRYDLSAADQAALPAEETLQRIAECEAAHWPHIPVECTPPSTWMISPVVNPSQSERSSTTA